MAASKRFGFTGDTVGVVVRGKVGPDHHPGLMEQHADCILPDGAPIGFFGEGDGDKVNSVGMSMKGVVYDYKAMRRHRKFYVDFDSARSYKLVSTVVLVKVSAAEAKAFAKYWAELVKKPGSFNMLGGNCSTHASEAFVVSKILKGGIPGLDTPDNLYAQLVKKRKSDVTVQSGYIGFATRPLGGYDMLIEPYTLSTKVAAPNQSSFSY